MTASFLQARSMNCTSKYTSHVALLVSHQSLKWIFMIFSSFFSLNSPNTPYILFYRRISTASSTPSSSVACSLDFPVPTNDDKLPNFEDLPAFLRQAISEDNAAYKKETRKFAFQQNKPLSKQNRWNDDDPPSSCGSNFDLQPNRFIY